jgi:16S rRNA (guanine(966)-N(2))-methyltransferase RsmD
MPVRIIAGKYRRRHLKTLEGDATRPMLDRMRETLFNILAPEIDGAVFVDLYAGSGAVGIEALSRGAASAIFVEMSLSAVGVIKENLALLGIADEAEILPMPVIPALKSITGDIVFLGPPYALTEEYEGTLAALGERPPRIVIAQHARQHSFEESYGQLRRTRVVKMGSSAISFFRPAPGEDESAE